MTTTATGDPVEPREYANREQRLALLEQRADDGAQGDRIALMTKEELLVVAELLDEFNTTTFNEQAGEHDPWGRLARVMAVQIYDRLGI